MKSLLLAVTLLAAPAYASTLDDVRDQWDGVSTVCFYGMDHDETPITDEARIKKACQEVIRLTEVMKANNICKTTEGDLVECP